MSIISEALKKIEKSSLSDHDQPQLLVPPHSRTRSLNLWIGFLLFAIVVGIVVKGFVGNHPNKKEISLGARQTSLEASAPLIVSLPSAKPPRKGFQLTGIALMNEGSFAIINGDVYQEGDKIRGAKLMQIRQDEVTLQQGEEEIRLSLK